MLQPQFQYVLREAGCDEVGRGSIAGPVCAAAVILPKGFSHPDIQDSKKLRPDIRLKLAEMILAKCECAAAMISSDDIDDTNITAATMVAIHQSLDKLPGVQLILMDGNHFVRYRDVEHKLIIGGDRTYQNIAAASIVAKTVRDKYMETMHKEYPQYGWDRNAGYGTPKHWEAIEKHGLSPLHRRTFIRGTHTGKQLKIY